jgi:stage II sporulation protein AB (anti-sigma F factor)
MNRMSLRFISMPDNVGLARVAVAALASQANFSLQDIDEIKVAVSEAVSNAIVHGYPGKNEGEIEVTGVLDALGLTVTVQDWGVGIEDIAQARLPAYSQDPERMGLGFVFMESFMHGLTVESTLGQGTRVEMQRLVTISGELSRDAQ